MKLARILAVSSLLLSGSAVVSHTANAASANADSTAEKKSVSKKSGKDQAVSDGMIYQAVIEPTPDSAVNSGMEASSQLVALQKTHAVGPYALAGRIRDDYERLQGALRSQGFYAGQIVIQIGARGKKIDGHDPLLAGFLANLPQGTDVKITISAKLGPQFHVSGLLLLPPPPKAAPVNETAGKKAEDDITGPKLKASTPRVVSLTPEEQKAFGLADGAPAIAADIIAARDRLAAFLQEEGYGLAELSPPQGILHSATHGLEVRIFITRGPKLVVGPLTLDGLKHVHPSYLRRRMDLRDGQLYQPSAIDAARLNLGETGLFSSVEVQNAPPVISIPQSKSLVPGVTQAMPLKFGFKEGKRYRVSGEVGYSTDLGGRAGVNWLDRNLLGNGEQMRLAAIATGLGGTAQQGLGYDIYADFNKPDFMVRDRTLNLRVEALRQLLYSYRQTAYFIRGGISQPIGKHWTVNGSGLVEQERINQFGTTRHYFIGSLPLQATFDNTGRSNPIEPATHGIRAALGITPSLSLEHQTALYFPVTAEAATYFDLTHLGISKPGRSVIAVRGTVGTIQGASVWNVPPDQRLYAGGPATVRGYRWQGVGPQWKNTKYAIGGTSMDAGTVEYRQRFFKSFGTALFVDAGQVGLNSTPGTGKLRVGYGGGVRYFTPIGPVRLDVAFPVKRPPHGDRWELYIGLGEVF